MSKTSETTSDPQTIELCSFQDDEELDGQALLLGDEEMRSPLLLLRRESFCDSFRLLPWWKRAFLLGLALVLAVQVCLLLVITIWVCVRPSMPRHKGAYIAAVHKNDLLLEDPSPVRQPNGWFPSASGDESVEDDEFSAPPPNATFTIRFHPIGPDVVIDRSLPHNPNGWDPPTFVPGTTKLALSGDGTRLAMASNFPAAADPYGGGGNVATAHWFQGSFGSSPPEPVLLEDGLRRKGHYVVQPGDRSFEGVNVAISADGTRLVQSVFHGEEDLLLGSGTPFRRGHVQTLRWDDHRHEWSRVQPILLLNDPWCPPWGLSVAVSGNGHRVAIGSPLAGTGEKASEDTNEWCQEHAHNAGGVVYVYDYDPSQGDWEKTAELEDPSGGVLRFGQTVSLSRDGSRLVVGFNGVDEDSGSSDSYCSLGRARVYDDWKKAEGWKPVGLDIVGYDRGCWGIHDGIRAEVSLDGNRIAITGAAAAQSLGVPTTYFSGHAQVFELSPDQEWIEMGSYVDGDYDSDEGSSDNEDHMYFGGSMALTEDGGRIVVGALSRGLRDLPLGHVRVFDWNPETLHWDQIAPDIDPEAPEELYFGANVAISSDGTRIAASFSRISEMGHVTNHVRTFQSGAL